MRTSDEKEYVIKLVTPETESKLFVGPYQIKLEAQALCSLNHRNIIKCYESGLGILDFTSIGECPNSIPACYIVLEYLKGGSLFDLMRKSPLDKKFAKDVFKDICKAVAHSHASGWIHRDIKPENVMFDIQTNGQFTTKLIDYGLACPFLGEFYNGLSYERVGSKYYWPPELQCFAYPCGYIPAKADIYSLGITLFEMSFSFSPFYYPRPWWNFRSFLDQRFWQEVEGLAQVEPDYLLRNLLGHMLTPNPLYRPSIEDVIAHAWLGNNI